MSAIAQREMFLVVPESLSFWLNEAELGTQTRSPESRVRWRSIPMCGAKLTENIRSNFRPAFKNRKGQRANELSTGASVCAASPVWERAVRMESRFCCSPQAAAWKAGLSEQGAIRCLESAAESLTIYSPRRNTRARALGRGASKLEHVA